MSETSQNRKKGQLTDRAKIPLVARTACGVDGIVDVSFALDSAPRGPEAPRPLGPPG